MEMRFSGMNNLNTVSTYHFNRQMKKFSLGWRLHSELYSDYFFLAGNKIQLRDERITQH